MASPPKGDDCAEPEEPLLVRFYSPTSQGTDLEGRTLNAILSWPNTRLESSHSYIQTIFPVPEPSRFNRIAPLVDRATFKAFRSRSDLRDRLRESLVCMLRFYGLELQVSVESGSREVTVIRGNNFMERAPRWVVRFNHNHQRMTRIIRSLRILGLEDEAVAFYSTLERIFRQNKDVISRTSLDYWTRAVERPLYWPPEDDIYNGKGKEFLLQLYREKEKAK